MSIVVLSTFAGVLNNTNLKVAVRNNALMEFFSVCKDLIAIQSDNFSIINRKLENASKLSCCHQVFEPLEMLRCILVSPKAHFSSSIEKDIIGYPRACKQIGCWSQTKLRNVNYV